MNKNKLEKSNKYIVLCICIIFIILGIVTLLFIKNLNKNSSDTNEKIKKAEQILYDQFGDISEEYIDGVKYTYAYSYIYVGEYMDKNNKTYYVFDLKRQIDDSNNVSSVGYYAVSTKTNEYYFVNNTDFKKTGVVSLEPKVINNENN